MPDEPETATVARAGNVATSATVATLATVATVAMGGATGDAAAHVDATVTITGADERARERRRDRDVELGSRVGRYIILDVVGRGGMGTVYRAHDPELDRRVAIKILRGRHAISTRDALLGEAQALARL